MGITLCDTCRGITNSSFATTQLLACSIRLAGNDAVIWRHAEMPPYIFKNIDDLLLNVGRGLRTAPATFINPVASIYKPHSVSPVHSMNTQWGEMRVSEYSGIFVVKKICVFALTLIRKS